VAPPQARWARASAELRDRAASRPVGLAAWRQWESATIGIVTSGLAGGISGAVAASGVTSLMTGARFLQRQHGDEHRRWFSRRVGRRLLTSAAYLAFGNSTVMPIRARIGDSIRPADSDATRCRRC